MIERELHINSVRVLEKIYKLRRLTKENSIIKYKSHDKNQFSLPPVPETAKR